MQVDTARTVAITDTRRCCVTDAVIRQCHDDPDSRRHVERTDTVVRYTTAGSYAVADTVSIRVRDGVPNRGAYFTMTVPFIYV